LGQTGIVLLTHLRQHLVQHVRIAAQLLNLANY
jgi:hypothetical protein